MDNGTSETQSLWRQVATALRGRVEQGQLKPGEKIPSSQDIAREFNVNRMTARRALASLEEEGLLRILHGSGTFVSEAPIPYVVGRRVHFDRNLEAVNARPERKLLRWWLEPATQDVAAALGLGAKAPLIALEIGAYANGHPIGIGTRFCCATRFSGFPEIFEELGSISETLKRFGVNDYHRAKTIVLARLPAPHEHHFLKSSKSLPVLAYTAIDQTTDGDPISCFIGCFSSQAIELHITD